MARNNKPVPHNVLITRFSALGDVAMTVPVVYTTCRANPQVNFVLVTRKSHASMMVNTPENLTVVGVDLSKYRGATGPMKLAANLQRLYNFDAMADLHGVLRTMLMAARLRGMGVKVKTINKGRLEKKRLVTGKARKQLPTSHQRYSDVMAALNLKTDKSFQSIYDYGQPPESLLVPEKEEGSKWIAVAPFSAHKGKEYPLERLQLVISTLAQNPQYRIFLFAGGEKEKKAIEPIFSRYNNVTSVAHIKHTFADELALMSHCDVMLTMDSANMHLASLVELPVVSIWGATHPWCGFMGWHQAMKDTVQLDMDCRPCSIFGNKECKWGDYRCLTSIDPQTIIDKVERVLSR